MKKAVIFDLDGLLIDSEVISHRLYDELLHRYGKSVTVAEYARDYSGKTGVANMTNVIARYNLPITVEEGLTWEVAREKELLQDVQLKPGAAALLSWLKTEGVAVVLATSSVRERAVAAVLRSQTWARKEAQYAARITEKPDGHCSIRCTIKALDQELFCLDIGTPDRLSADLVKKQFILKGNEIYQMLITKLTE